jgi:phage gp29-like protein
MVSYGWSGNNGILLPKEGNYYFDVSQLNSLEKKVDKFAGIEIGLNTYENYQEICESLDMGISTYHTRGEILNDKGFDSLERLERNTSIHAALTNFKLSVVEPSLIVKPKNNSYNAGYAKDMLEFILDEMEGTTEDLAFDLMSAILPGYSISELVYTFLKYEKETIKGLRAVKNKKPGLYGFYIDAYDNIQAVRNLLNPEIALPKNKFILYAFLKKHGNPYGFAYFDILYPVYRAINELFKYLIIGSAKWANPSMVIYVPNGKLSPEDQSAVKTFANQITQSSVSSLPESMKATILEIARSGQNPIIEMLHYLISEVEKVLLLNDLTVSQSTGGGTRAETDSKIAAGKEPLIRYTRKNLQGVLNEQLVRRVLRQNLDPDEFPVSIFPTLMFNVQEKETRNAFVSMVGTLTDKGYVNPASRTDRAWVRDGVEAPREDGKNAGTDDIIKPEENQIDTDKSEKDTKAVLQIDSYEYWKKHIKKAG